MHTAEGFTILLCEHMAAPRWAVAGVLPKPTPLWTKQMAHPQTDTPAREQIKRDEQAHKMPTRLDRAEGPFYPDDLLPRLQQTLAALADVQIRFEIERDFLEDWSGSAEVKDCLVAELNRCHTANRGRLVSCLAQLQREARSSEPAPPKRTDH
jgi:hypothetical protein